MSSDENQIDFDSLKSLNADLGVDMSFLDTMKKDYDDAKQNEATGDLPTNKVLKLDEKTSKELQDTIQKNAELIQELKVLTKKLGILVYNDTKPIVKLFSCRLN